MSTLPVVVPLFQIYVIYQFHMAEMQTHKALFETDHLLREAAAKLATSLSWRRQTEREIVQFQSTP